MTDIIQVLQSVKNEVDTKIPDYNGTVEISVPMSFTFPEKDLLIYYEENKPFEKVVGKFKPIN